MYAPSAEARPLLETIFRENSDFFAYNGPDCCRRYGIGVFLGLQGNLPAWESESRIVSLDLDKASTGISKVFYIPASVLDTLSKPNNMNAETWRFIKEQSRRYVPPQQVVVVCEVLQTDWILGKYLPY